MGRPGPQPRYTFFARIDPDTDKRRRRLQRRLNCTASELIKRALRELEACSEDASSPAKTVA
jgi:hypothetical protein